MCAARCKPENSDDQLTHTGESMPTHRPEDSVFEAPLCPGAAYIASQLSVDIFLHDLPSCHPFRRNISWQTTSWLHTIAELPCRHKARAPVSRWSRHLEMYLDDNPDSTAMLTCYYAASIQDVMSDERVDFDFHIVGSHDRFFRLIVNHRQCMLIISIYP